MAAYLVGAIEIHDEEGYARYRAGIAQALAPFLGVSLLSSDDHPDVIEGTQPANHLLLIRFPSAEQVREFFASEAYQQIVGFRHAASEARFVMTMRDPAEVTARIA